MQSARQPVEFSNEPCVYRHCEGQATKQSSPEPAANSALDCFAKPVIGRRFAPTRWARTVTNDRRASSPRAHSGHRARRSFLFRFPHKGRAEPPGEEPRPWRPHRLIRAPACRSRNRHTGSRMHRLSPGQHAGWPSVATGPATEAVFRLRSARGWTLRFAACPQELSLLSTRRLVRTDCRPDMHLDRPPDAPALIALVPRLPDVPSVIRELLGPAS